MSKPSTLPRGIKAVEWRNAVEGTTSTRYRARMVRADEHFKLDRLCNNLDDAMAILAEAKTLDGRKRIAKGRDCLTLRDRKHDIQKHVEATADDSMRSAIAHATVSEVAALDGPTAAAPTAKPLEPPSPADLMRAALTQAVAKTMLMDAASGRMHTLGDIVKRYVATHLAAIAAPASIGKVRENTRTAAKLMKIRLENAMRTPMLYLPRDKRPENPLVGAVALAYESKNAIRQTLGDWRMVELDVEVGEAYIRQRLTPYIDAKGDTKTRSPLTIKREIVDLNKVINDLRESDRGMWKVIGSENKLSPCTRSSMLLKKKAAAKSDGAKRWRRINASEEELLLEYLTTGSIKLRRTADEIAGGVEKTIKRKRNPELVFIFRLSIAMGLRVSECVLLEWSNVDLQANTIYLGEGEAKKGPRRPMITRDAHRVLADIREYQRKKKKEGPRLFHYTVQGFKGTFRKIRAASGIKDMVWHDLRRTAIARIWESIPGAKPVEIAQWFGAQDVKHFEENMLIPIKQSLGNERGVFVDERHARQSVGHASVNMTNHYAYFTQGRSPAVAPTTIIWTMNGATPPALGVQPMQISASATPPLSPRKESE